MPSLKDRLAHSWNAFKHPEDANQRNNGPGWEYSYGSSENPSHKTFKRTSKNSIVVPIYNMIAVSASSVKINHARVDENGKYIETLYSGLNECLTIEANIDQTGRQFLQDVVTSMIDEGTVAIVPIETTVSPMKTGGYDIKSLRVGKILEWYPDKVKIDVYNEYLGRHQDVILPKKMVGIVENPLYSVMNEPNSFLQRLLRKLALLDQIDDNRNSSKLDLLISLPYTTRGQTKKNQAKERKAEIEDQLVNSKYGIAYIDATEKVTQLNRPLENNLFEQIKYLYTMAMNQLGMTEEIFNGTANEAAQINFFNTTIEPIVSAICDELKRKFLTKTARTQGQSIVYYRDPFRLVPVSELAKIVDVFSRNAILSANEVRALIGYRPDDSAQSDALTNKNMPMEEQMQAGAAAPEEESNGDVYGNGYYIE